MRFYDALQLDPAVLKDRIKKAPDGRERLWFMTALLVRDVLLVAFAIVFILFLTSVFGQENSSMAVIIFCILLSIRFVSFGYKAKHSVINLAAVFGILTVSPVYAQHLGPLAGFAVHFISLSLILVITCEYPEMGNGGLYLFGYIFLAGNPVEGSALAGRAMMALVGFGLCGAILFFRHRKKHKNVSFLHVVGRMSIYDPKCQWQLRLAFGLSLLFLLNRALNLNRFMWAGFACSSLLSSYPVNLRGRLAERAGGIVLGSLLFAAVYRHIPESFLFMVGPAAGLCLGICSSYFAKTVLNCFGALLMAAGTYGLSAAVSVRIVNNLLGIAFGLLFFKVYEKAVRAVCALLERLKKREADSMQRENQGPAGEAG
ncbi:MAG: FUSC family protein [Clostridium sp.]|nr:FUSC family protein [Clostridium sp.]